MTRKKNMIIILVLLLVVGFAAISTTLVINGIVGISSKASEFKVIFTNAILDGVENKELIKGADKILIDFSSKELKNINDTTTLEYEVTNTSRLYNAEVSVACNIVDDTDQTITSEYITMDYNPKSMTVVAGKTETGSITATLTKSSTESQDIRIKCTLTATANERDTLGDKYIPPYNIILNTNGGEATNTNYEVEYGKSYGELPIPTKENAKFLGWYTEAREKVETATIVNNKEEHTLNAEWYEIVNDLNGDGIEDVGDEIAIGEEHFYVISNNEGTIYALAKYNLNVGSKKNSNVMEGIQHETARGFVPPSNSTYGAVKFSNQKGWSSTNKDINMRYLDGPVKDALYGENGYEKYIQKRIPDAEVELITYYQITSLGCSSTSDTVNTCSNAPEWVYSTSYWTQSAAYYYDTDYYIWTVRTGGQFVIDNFDNGNGVRPVVRLQK